ncbi:MAG: cysteine desulfurase [Firmicutes bacterium]|nr:cysteine desulfurase [Bacillota bacterium]
MPDKMIFFDHTSTTPLDPRVLEVMLPYFKENFGNPSSHVHSLGQIALKAVDKAREQVAALISAKPSEIIFTSGATEANNLAVKGIANANKTKGRHILISQIEHYSVMNTAMFLNSQGFETEQVPVGEDGFVKLDELEKMIREDTILISIMLSNTEIGVIEPVKQAVEIAKRKNPAVIFHTDAASSAGIIPVDVNDLGVDALTLSAHNFYGPKGAAALYLREGTKLFSLFEGGFQESGYRSGTENVPAIVGMGEAARLAKEEMPERNRKIEALGKKLWNGLAEKIEYLHFTGSSENRLPGHVSFWVEFAEGESILLFLAVKGIAAASGSACSSNLRARDEDELVGSHVLAAVGVPTDICSGSITFMLGKDSTEEEVDYVLETLPPIIQRLWSMSPSYEDMLKNKK